MWQSFSAVFRKEFLHMLRDKGTVRLVLMIPLLQLCLFGFIDQTVHDVPTVVVDQDRSSDSRDLIDRLRASKTFRIDAIITSSSDAHDAIRKGSARIAVVLPPDFHRRKLRRDDAQVLVLIDGSDSTVSAQALASINGRLRRRICLPRPSPAWPCPRIPSFSSIPKAGRRTTSSRA